MHPVAAREPDPCLSVIRVLKADGAVGEVVRPLCLSLGPSAPLGFAASSVPRSRGSTQSLEPLGVELATIALRPIVIAPMGVPIVFKADTLSSIDDVLDVAMLRLKEIDPLPHVWRKLDRDVRPYAHDEIGAKKPHDMPPEAAVHLAPRRGGPGRVRPLGERTAAAAVENARHRP